MDISITSNLHYIGSNESINWLFILCCLAVIQWVITIIYVSKNYNILGRSIEVKELNHYRDKISFTHDYYYIYWNIYPILFYAFFYYIDTSWNAYFNQIVMIGGYQVKDLYDNFFIELPLGSGISYKFIDTLILIIMISFAYMATFGTQIKKQKQFMDETNKVYWWDIRIVKELYWIRFIFLFFNMVLVGFVAYITTKVALFVLALLSMGDIIFNINPFHPDLFGGLRVLMEISSIILAIYLLRAMLGIVGFLDHRGVDDTFQFIGDLYHSVYFALGIGFIMTFVYQIDNILESVNIKEYLSPEKFKDFNMDINMSTSEIADKAGNMANYYANLLQFNKFPVDLSLFTSSIFTFILPLSLWFIVSFMDNRKEELLTQKGTTNAEE